MPRETEESIAQAKASWGRLSLEERFDANGEVLGLGQRVEGMAAWQRFVDEIPEDRSIGSCFGWDLDRADGSGSTELVARSCPGLKFRVTFTAEGTLRAFTIEHFDRSPSMEEHAAEITARLIRSVPVGEIVAEARNAMARDLAQMSSTADWAKRIGSVPRPGRRGRDDEFYASIAADYCIALSESLTPVKDLAASNHLSESQLRSLLHEARRRDLLTASPRGRAGGSLTPKARALLESANPEEN